MKVSALMQRDVATVAGDDRLDRAVEQLQARDCGCVVVVDSRRHPVGVVTDRDAALAALRTGRPLADIRVGAAMSKRLFTCRDDTTVAEAADRMSLHQVRRLPVVDTDGRLVGVVALDDLAREACLEADLLAPRVSCASVGRTLGAIVRPRLIETDETVEAS